MGLQDKVVVITAATRGIGYATAVECARQGAKVFLGARDLARGEATAKPLREQGLWARVVYNDATRPESFRAMIEEVMAQAGRLDGLVNNFGTSDPKRDRDILSTAPEDFEEILRRNVMSVFRAGQAAAEVMGPGGSIVNISSVGGAVPDIAQIAYGVSKGAINYLTRVMAVQLAGRGIRCNAVLPGMTATRAVEDNLSPAFRALFLRHIPLGRMGTPEEMAGAVAYFLDDRSAYATGQILALSGGFGLATPLYGDLASAAEKR